MSTIQATIRETKTKGQVNELRNKGNVPGIVYGGEQPNEKISRFIIFYLMKSYLLL